MKVNGEQGARIKNGATAKRRGWRSRSRAAGARIVGPGSKRRRKYIRGIKGELEWRDSTGKRHEEVEKESKKVTGDGSGP